MTAVSGEVAGAVVEGLKGKPLLFTCIISIEMIPTVSQMTPLAVAAEDDQKTETMEDEEKYEKVKAIVALSEFQLQFFRNEPHLVSNRLTDWQVLVSVNAYSSLRLPFLIVRRSQGLSDSF